MSSIIKLAIASIRARVKQDLQDHLLGAKTLTAKEMMGLLSGSGMSREWPEGFYYGLHPVYTPIEPQAEECERVYLAQCSSTTHTFFKIGYTTNVAKRLQDCQTFNPFKVDLFATFDGGRSLEKWLHRRYAEFNERGEWFRLPPWTLLFLLSISEQAATRDAEIRQIIGDANEVLESREFWHGREAA